MAAKPPKSAPAVAAPAAPGAVALPAVQPARRTVLEVHFRYHIEVPGVGWVRRLIRGEEIGAFPGNTSQRTPEMSRDADTGELIVGAYRLGLSSPHIAAYRLED